MERRIPRLRDSVERRSLLITESKLCSLVEDELQRNTIEYFSRYFAKDGFMKLYLEALRGKTSIEEVYDYTINDVVRMSNHNIDIVELRNICKDQDDCGLSRIIGLYPVTIMEKILSPLCKGDKDWLSIIKSKKDFKQGVDYGYSILDERELGRSKDIIFKMAIETALPHISVYSNLRLIG